MHAETTRVPGGRRISGATLATLFALMLGSSVYYRLNFSVSRPHNVETVDNEVWPSSRMGSIPSLLIAQSQCR